MSDFLEKFDRVRVVLAGGFSGQLTCEETNKWGRYVREHPAWGRYRVAHVRSEVAVRLADYTEAEAASQEFEVAMSELRNVAREWFAALRAEEMTP